MRVITGTRGSGKTSQLVMDANILAQQGHNVIILAETENHAETFRRYKLNSKIKVVSFSSFKRDSIGNPAYKNADLLIDEFDWILPKLLGHNIASVTVDKENVAEVSRKD